MALDPYYQLGVRRAATPDEIKKAYRKLAAIHHPDKCPGDPHATTRFQLIKEAYEILSDPERRARLDRGEDASPFNPRFEALSALASCFLQVLQHKGPNAPIREMRKIMKGVLDQQKANQAVLTAGIANYEKAKNRFRYRGAEENVLAIAIDSQIAKLQTELTANRHAVAVNTDALKMLAEYDDVDGPPTFGGVSVFGPGLGNFR